jgi:hypothetical protein
MGRRKTTAGEFYIYFSYLQDNGPIYNESESGDMINFPFSWRRKILDFEMKDLSTLYFKIYMALFE